MITSKHFVYRYGIATVGQCQRREEKVRTVMLKMEKFTVSRLVLILLAKLGVMFPPMVRVFVGYIVAVHR